MGRVEGNGWVGGGVGKVSGGLGGRLAVNNGLATEGGWIGWSQDE